MELSKIKMNPANRTMQYDLPEEPARHLARVQQMLKAVGVPVLLVEKGLDGNDRWLNNSLPMGMPSGGLTIVPWEGRQYLIDGYGIVEQGKAERRSGMQWGQTSAQVLSGLSAEDLLELLGTSKKLGVIYPERLKAHIVTYLTQRIAGLELIDLTAQYAMAKAVKSEEELEVVAQVTKQCDLVFGAIPTMLRAGLYERDVVGEIRRVAYKTGSGGFPVFYQAMVELTSRPAGRAPEDGPVYWPGRKLAAGDFISVRTHISGMNGFYGCLGRCYLLGKADEAVQAQWRTAVEAQELMVREMKPGSSLSKAAQAARNYITACGYDADFSAAAYSLGYWMSESPMLGNSTEELPLEAGMVFTLAPGVCSRNEQRLSMACADTYAVTANGAVRLTQLPQELMCLS